MWIRRRFSIGGSIERLVKRLRVACTVPLYPLAPEHQRQADIAFAGETYRRLVAEHGAQKLLVMGDSAAGGLALAMLQQAKDAPAGLMLNAPWLDASVSDPSQVEIERQEWLLNRLVLRTWGTWWAGERGLSDPLVSPCVWRSLPPSADADVLWVGGYSRRGCAPAGVGGGRQGEIR
jgi:acetyl esterase/lipase